VAQTAYMPGGAKILILQGADWISTASGSERPLAKSPLATARGTDSSPRSRSCRRPTYSLRGFFSRYFIAGCANNSSRSFLPSALIQKRRKLSGLRYPSRSVFWKRKQYC